MPAALISARLPRACSSILRCLAQIGGMAFTRLPQSWPKASQQNLSAVISHSPARRSAPPAPLPLVAEEHYVGALAFPPDHVDTMVAQDAGGLLSRHPGVARAHLSGAFFQAVFAHCHSRRPVSLTCEATEPSMVSSPLHFDIRFNDATREIPDSIIVMDESPASTRIKPERCLSSE